MAQRVEDEGFHLGDFERGVVLLLHGGGFDVTARRAGRENEVAAVSGRLAHVEDGLHALAGRDHTTRSAALPFVNDNEAVAQVFPLQTEALLRAQGAIEKDRDDVLEQIGIRASGLLAALDGANARKGLLVGRLDLVADSSRGPEVLDLFFERQHSLAMVLAGKQLDLGEQRLHLAPLDGEMKHAAQRREIAIDGGDFDLVELAARHEAGYMLGGDLIEAEVCEFTERYEVLDAVLVEADRIRLGRLGGRDERKERLLGEVLERGCGFLLSNTNLAFRQGGAMRGFDLLGDALIGLLGAFAYLLAVPGELVPPVLGTLLLVDHLRLLDC